MPLIFPPSVNITSLGVQNLLPLCELFIFSQFLYVSSSVGPSLTWESSRHFGDATSGWPAKRTKKFHTEDVSLPRSGWCIKFKTWHDELAWGNRRNFASLLVPAKRRLRRNERRNSILMTCHYPDLGSASDWSCSEGKLFRDRLSEKVHATTPKGIMGGWEFTALQKNLKERHDRPWTYVCDC